MYYRAKLDREGDRWLVEFEDCPGCQTFGGSREHALVRAQEALEGWLESMLDLRRVPPRPLAQAGVPVYVNGKLSIALQLRLAREEQGFSQSDVAERAGVSQQQIARLESVDNNPTLATVIAAAHALGLRLELVSDELGGDMLEFIFRRHREEITRIVASDVGKELDDVHYKDGRATAITKVGAPIDCTKLVVSFLRQKASLAP